MDERVKKTIGEICEWIEKRLKKDDTESVPEMTKALAELVHANSAKSNTTNYNIVSS